MCAQGLSDPLVVCLSAGHTWPTRNDFPLFCFEPSSDRFALSGVFFVGQVNKRKFWRDIDGRSAGNTTGNFPRK